mmetsp:Transcript_23501/g.35721  ORF Transcript_23501/g.35721 Transcript_23501/m.35721 type:complete len:80 (-) Transcript_23501:341-580(-)
MIIMAGMAGDREMIDRGSRGLIRECIREVHRHHLLLVQLHLSSRLKVETRENCMAVLVEILREEGQEWTAAKCGNATEE